jgi:hypothetical protein
VQTISEEFMEQTKEQPSIYHILQGEALEIRHNAYGSVGKLFRGEGVEAVWVKKEGEEIDPDWFSQAMVDLILVVHGKLKFEFERTDLSPCVLEPGDMLVLPQDTKCRAYRWPWDAEQATMFLAVYPSGGR